MTQETCSLSEGGKGCCLSQCTAETWAFLALRFFLGLRLVTAALGKFAGATGYAFANHHEKFVSSQVSVFANDTFLPVFMLKPYLHALPYMEGLIGILLLLGVRNKCALGSAGMLFVSIAFGMMLLPPGQGAQAVTSLGIYILLVVSALALVKHNKFSVCKCS